MNDYFIVTAFGRRERQWIFDRLEDAFEEIKLNPVMFDFVGPREVAITCTSLTAVAYHARCQAYAHTRDMIESEEI